MVTIDITDEQGWKTCVVDGCDKPIRSRVSSHGQCKAHREMFLRYGRTTRVRAENGKPEKGKYHRGKSAHRNVAELALGKPLPSGAEIHHIDGNGFNNSPDNLVICQDHSYHMLLHARERIIDKKTGVYWDAENKKWRSQINLGGKTYYNGRHKNKDDAYNANIRFIGVDPCQ